MSHLNSIEIVAGLINDLVKAWDFIIDLADYAPEHFQRRHDAIHVVSE